MSEAIARPSATLPPAQPTYVLRGHVAQIHSICFLRQNSRLLTGDAKGWVVLWSVASKRAVAVWRPHQGAILGLDSWGEDKIITHGRDNKLHVWQLPESAEAALSTTLPIDDQAGHRKEPWLLHSLDVNTLNFCSFDQCPARPAALHSGGTSGRCGEDDILITVPGTRDGDVLVYSMPSSEVMSKISRPDSISGGIIMSVQIFHHYDSINRREVLYVLAGYESGHVCLWQQGHTGTSFTLLFQDSVHSQPVLSVGVAPDLSAYFSSGADALISCSYITPGDRRSMHPGQQTHTKHAGQQSLRIRSDGKIFATAGWDGRLRVYSAKTMKELAVLKWHKEGCYALAFADVGLQAPAGNGSAGADVQVTPPSQQGAVSLSERRNLRAQSTHWLAAGSKDGKISLWDIY